MPRLIDRKGQRFGRWLLLAKDPRKTRPVRWICRCDCGTERSVSVATLCKGESNSCGCLHNELTVKRQTSHGATKRGRKWTPEFRSWWSAKQRATNPNLKSAKNYYDRGIRMADAWLNSFEQFLADMGPRPDGMSLDRIDVNRGYEPGNCRWATVKQQRRNTRFSVFIEYQGRKMNAVEFAELIKCPRDYVSKWIKLGKTPEQMIARAIELKKLIP